MAVERYLSVNPFKVIDVEGIIIEIVTGNPSRAYHKLEM